MFNRASVLMALSLSLSVSVVLSGGLAEARKRGGRSTPVEETAPSNPPAANITEASSDGDLLRAIADGKRLDFVEGGQMTVTKNLPDDLTGLKHQKWMVKFANGAVMEAVFNIDMCPLRVPLKEGDVIAMGGSFLMAGNMPMLHWLHGDPQGKHPAGYVYLNGKFYCKTDFIPGK